MQGPRPTTHDSLQWPLLLGPAGRTGSLHVLLTALLEVRAEEQERPHVERLGDLEDLLGAPWDEAASGRLVLDGDSIPIQDLGLVTRFLDRSPGWDVFVLGEDDRNGVVRQLLSHPTVRWGSWPLDLDQVHGFLNAPGMSKSQGTTHAARPSASSEWGVARSSELQPASLHIPHAGGVPSESSPSGLSSAPPEPSGGSLEEDLTAIEAILAGDESAPDDPTLLEEDLDDGEPRTDPFTVEITNEEYAAFLESPTEPESLPPTEPQPKETDAPPSWYRSQVADLADIAQRLDLALVAHRESLEEADADPEVQGSLDESTERLCTDVLRLVQFARTLGYLVAPPSAGTQDLRLDTLLEETLKGLAGGSAEGPRFLFRAQDPLTVRSDKGLLLLVLDTLLSVAGAAAGPQGEVRASALETAPSQDPPSAEVRISFPAGPLGELPPGEVLEPYGLRGSLPGVGPNALAAAARISQGQGGELLYGDGDEEGLALFLLRLPKI